MESCQSGLTYLFAKEAGCKSPREFESRRLRQNENFSFNHCTQRGRDGWKVS